jgi:NitT/TauT family transport system ATP-binding protein
MPSPPPLPHAAIGQIQGLLEVMQRTPGPDTVSGLAQDLLLELDDLLPVLRATQMLGWVRVAKGRYDLTQEGERVVEGGEPAFKAAFRARAAKLPLIREILSALEARGGEPVGREEVLERFAGHFPRPEAEKQLETAIGWGRYAELMDYDTEAGLITKA